MILRLDVGYAHRQAPPDRTANHIAFRKEQPAIEAARWTRLHPPQGPTPHRAGPRWSSGSGDLGTIGSNDGGIGYRDSLESVTERGLVARVRRFALTGRSASGSGI